jgi:hypothetical protein
MEKIGVGIVAVLALVAVVLAASALTGWLVMIAIGVLFNAGVVPATIGFWPDAVVIGLIFGSLTGGAFAAK